MLNDLAYLILRFLEVQKIRDEIEPYLIEIGIEGKLSNMQLKEILGNLDQQMKYFVMDYALDPIEESKAEEVIGGFRSRKKLQNLDIAEGLGYDVASVAEMEEEKISPRGYRVLIQSAGIPLNVAENVVQAFGDLHRICSAEVGDLKDVEGIGKKRANVIFESVRRLKDKSGPG